MLDNLRVRCWWWPEAAQARQSSAVRLQLQRQAKTSLCQMKAHGYFIRHIQAGCRPLQEHCRGVLSWQQLCC